MWPLTPIFNPFDLFNAGGSSDNPFEPPGSDPWPMVAGVVLVAVVLGVAAVAVVYVKEK